MKGQKTGGRTAGTPNRSTRQVKDFLARVFTRAFTETVQVVAGDGETAKVVDVTLEDELVRAIITLSIEPNLLRFLMTMYAGSPARQVDVHHKGTVTLAQLIAGTAPLDGDEDEDAPTPPAPPATSVN